MTLIIKNLSKKYDSNLVIKDVSLEVERGEILGVFGVVGEGKTTLIRSIAGIMQLDGGTIHFDTQDITLSSCKERGFHFPDLTNESFWTSIFKTDKNSQLADGEGQALALEDAISKAKDVLLLDNQFCFMDRQTRERNCEKLRQAVKEKKLAVIFATNNYDEIFSICDRVAVLHKGEIVQTGTPRKVYENPQTAAVADITGRNNLIEAKRVTSNKSDMPEFQTVKGKHRLFTDKNKLESADENVILAIRPEHISISFGASFPEDNLVKAKITNIVFKGETTLIMLDADGLELQAMVLRLVGLNIGDECMVGLPPDRILVL
ncbi:putative 2-aminoethylphosphonate ABC transporter ATP-binding protein [soil metagenome]